MGMVNIEIKGLSASYYKNGVWNVIFPCDGEHHRVNFDYIKSDDSSIEPISLQFKSINIKTDSFVAPKSIQHDNFEKVLDLTSTDLHKEGLKFARNPFLGKSVMTVENAFFFTAESRNRWNFIFNARIPTGIKPTSSEFASIVGVEIELEDAGTVTMEVNGMPGFPLTFRAGDKLYFDNYCEVCRNDFRLYQDIFVNSSDETIKFEMLSFPLPSRTIVEPTIETLRLGPPPSFCDGTRISVVDDL